MQPAETDEFQEFPEISKKVNAYIDSSGPEWIQVTDNSNEIKGVSCDLDDFLVPTTLYTRISHLYGLKAAIRSITPDSEIIHLNDEVERLYCELSKIIVQKGANYRKHFDELFEAEGYGGEDLRNLVEIARAGYRLKAEEVFWSGVGMRRQIKDISEKVDGNIGIVTTHERRSAQVDKLVLSNLYDCFDPEKIIVVGNGTYMDKADGITLLSHTMNIPLGNIAHVDDRFSSLSEVKNTPAQTIYFFNQIGKYCVGERREKFNTLKQTPDYMISIPEQVIPIIEKSKN